LTHDEQTCTAADAASHLGFSVSEAELRQWRSPVGAGPSSKTWPRWAAQRLHNTSVRVMKKLRSLFTGRGVAFSGLRQPTIGIAAAGVTYGVGKLMGVALAG
jgi:hypothetical protein